MSDEYTPTMAEIRAEYAKGASEEIALYQSSIFGDHPYKPKKGERVTHYLSKQIIPGERANAHAEFDRMIAEVERAAAEKALLAVAESLKAALAVQVNRFPVTDREEGIRDGMNRSIRTVERAAAQYRRKEQDHE